MRTDFDADFLATDRGQRANDILRACVHCGFCNATCPTYQITGDELDGPRGRIYLMREFLETGENEARVTQHLDRCLTCRACETTCPSGVAYGELAEIAREQIGPQRSGVAGLMRRWLRWMVPSASRTRTMAGLGRPFRWLLPQHLAKNIPTKIGNALAQPARVDAPRSRVILLNGCAQQVAAAATNEALAALLREYGVDVLVTSEEACCGSLDLHLGDGDAALDSIRRNVDALAGLLATEDVDAIVSTASGCGVTIKDYGRLLANDPEYAEIGDGIANLVLDVSEYVEELALPLVPAGDPLRVAWHPPCTLQHGQQLTGIVEALLTAAGHELVPVRDAHLCCGSAGTYSILEPRFAGELKAAKLAALEASQPDVIATANVGCQSHLNADSGVPVVHWIELVK